MTDREGLYGPPSGPEALPGRRRPFFQNAKVLHKFSFEKVYSVRLNLSLKRRLAYKIILPLVLRQSY
jgi:hypothetical protein